MRTRSWAQLVLPSLTAVLLMFSACAKPTPTPTPAGTPAASPAPTPIAAPVTPKPATLTPTPIVISPTRPTGELRMAVSSFSTESTDPAHQTSSGIIYMAYIYDHLVGWGGNGKYSKANGLAKDWTVSPDAKTWTFFLREGVKFHDGTELTSEDVKFTLERYMKPGPTSSRAAQLKKQLKEVTAPSRYQVVVKLNEGDVGLDYTLSGFGGSEGMILPKAYFQQVGEDGFANKPMGSGPWKFVERVVGSYIKFEANEAHWHQVPAYKRFTMFVVPEEATRVAVIRTGQADVVEIVSESVEQVEKAGLGIKINPAVLTPMWIFGRGFDPAFIYNDKRVRQALALSFNQAEIVEHLLGKGSQEAPTMFTPAMEGYDPNLKPYPYDPAKAKQLLSEASIDPSKVELKLWSYARPGYDVPKIVEAAAGFWQKLGFKVKIVPSDWGAFRPRYQATPQKFEPPAELYPMSATARPDSTLTMNTYYVSDKLGGTAGRWGNIFPEIDQWWTEAKNSADPAKRDATLREMNRFIYDNYLNISLGMVPHLFAINQKKVGQWVLPLSFRNIWAPETIAPPK